MTDQPLGAAQIDAILPYLKTFEQPDFLSGNWRQKSPQRMPYFDFSSELQRFYKALYDHGWVRSFAWPDWQGEAEQYVKSPYTIATADIETIAKLLTTHARKERFCEGHLASMLENGNIQALLRRLKEIRETL